MKPLEILLLAILGGFVAIFLFLSREYNPTAALFPQWIAIASLLFLAVLIIRARANSVTLTEFEVQNSVNVTELVPRRSAVFFLQGAYIVLIYLFGFFAATFLYLFVAPVQLRYQRRGVVFAHAVFFTVVLAGSFLWLFDVQFPSGAIWDLW